MGGTLTVQSGARLPVSVRLGVSSGMAGLERVGRERVGWCTLLGPEGPGFLIVWGVSSEVRLGGWGLGRYGPSVGCMKSGVVSGGVWCRSYVENYTVDASIFRFASSMIVSLRGGVKHGVGSQF